MASTHPLLDPAVISEIERATSDHLGRRWTHRAFVDLDHRASHPSGVFRGGPFSVFVKLSAAIDAQEQLVAELRGLRVVRDRTAVAAPAAIGAGVIRVPSGWLLLLEALPGRAPEARRPDDWRAIGHALAGLHRVHDERFGLEAGDGFFGPLRQDNRPVGSNRWAEFYGARRLQPLLRSAVDSGHLPAAVGRTVERIIDRMPGLVGPEPRPALLHGDAQQHNFLSCDGGAVVVDAAPYFGHPEIDLALVDYFHPVPDEVFRAYREVAPIDTGFAGRRELWRMFAYLAVITVDGSSSFGRPFVGRLIDAVRTYR